MNESLMGMIKSVAQSVAGENNIACTVSKTSPLQLTFEGDNKVVLDKSVLIIPSHIKGLSKGSTVYVMPASNGTGYIVLGKG